MFASLNIAEVSHTTASTGFLRFKCGCYVYLDRLNLLSPWELNRVFMPGLCSGEHTRWWKGDA